MRDAVRVALLARPGAGADRLRAALQAAGADVVLDADPTTLAPAELSAAGAGSVVVLLDAAVEDALDRLDPVLHDPAIDVLYEEAEVAAAREGWDVARWTRHLSAKLLRHGDVLPPGRETDASPPPPPATVEPSAVAFAETEVASDAPPGPMMFDPVAAEYDADADPGEDVAVPDFGSLSLEAAEAVEAFREPEQEPEPPEPEPESLPELQFEPEPEPEPDSIELTLDGDPPSTDATATTAESGSETIRDFRRDLADIEKRIAAMSLVGEAPAAEPAAGTTTASTSEPAGEPTTASDASADAAIEAPATAAARTPAAGAVLVLAGIGGPDAVRQFLGELPAQFPRPVLIQQRLDGGRHDRLVQQMARATSLPVSLAADGDAAMAGHVYVLPPDVGLSMGEDGLRFVSGGSPITTLPAADSAVLMFSGSDTALVDAAMEHAQAGALVAGQSPEDCYDAAASDALVARGAESGQPAELARRLAGRWAA